MVFGEHAVSRIGTIGIGPDEVLGCVCHDNSTSLRNILRDHSQNRSDKWLKLDKKCNEEPESLIKRKQSNPV